MINKFLLTVIFTGIAMAKMCILEEGSSKFNSRMGVHTKVICVDGEKFLVLSKHNAITAVHFTDYKYCECKKTINKEKQ